MSQSPLLVFCVILIASFFLLFFIYTFVTRFHDFRRELLFLNTEIGRTTDSERAYWIRRKKHLWLSLIPFYPYKKR